MVDNMSIIPSIVTIVVVILLISLIARFLKGVFKVLLTLFLVLVIVLSVLLFFVYQDSKRITNPQAPVVMILVSQGKTCTGVISTNKEPKPINESNITVLKDLVDKKEYSRLFIVHKELFNKNYSINITGININVKQATDIACSENLNNYLKSLGFEDWFIKTIDKHEFKANLFVLSYARMVEASVNPGLFIAKSIKNKSIEVYPNSIIFRLLKFMPESLFKKVGNKLAKTL